MFDWREGRVTRQWLGHDRSVLPLLLPDTPISKAETRNTYPKPEDGNFGLGTTDRFCPVLPIHPNEQNPKPETHTRDPKKGSPKLDSRKQKPGTLDPKPETQTRGHDSSVLPLTTRNLIPGIRSFNQKPESRTPNPENRKQKYETRRTKSGN